MMITVCRPSNDRRQRVEKAHELKAFAILLIRALSAAGFTGENFQSIQDKVII
jgi:hypothetical protein